MNNEGYSIDAPSGWEAKRLRFVTALSPSKSEARNLSSKTEVSFLPMESIGDDGTVDLSQTKLISEVINGYTYFRENDVVIAKITPCFENGKGAIAKGLVNGIGFGTTELIVARPRPDHTTAGYLHWVFRSVPFRQLGEAAMYGAGGQKRMPDDFVRNFKFPFPTVASQRFISAFLDRKTAQIDALIAAYERLMALLEEKRQAVITQAVTKGLDPTVPMKDSGVEWLGEVPDHWEPRKIAHAFAQIGSGTTPPTGQDEWYSDSDGGMPWITTGELRETVITETVKYVTAKALDEFSTLRVHPAGALAIAMYGATIGRLGILGVAATTNQACCVLSGEISLRIRFVYFWLLAFRQQIVDLYAVGSGQPNINQEVITSLRVPAPTFAEQEGIVSFLDRETERIDVLISKVRTSIDLLKELRSTLITAAVTGQIDVTEEVTQDA